MGLSLMETLDTPFGELMDLVAVDQIKSGIAKERRDEDFFDLLQRK